MKTSTLENGKKRDDRCSATWTDCAEVIKRSLTPKVNLTYAAFFTGSEKGLLLQRCDCLDWNYHGIWNRLEWDKGSTFTFRLISGAKLLMPLTVDVNNALLCLALPHLTGKRRNEETKILNRPYWPSQPLTLRKVRKTRNNLLALRCCHCCSSEMAY